jgi:hypothetical protein
MPMPLEQARFGVNPLQAYGFPALAMPPRTPPLQQVERRKLAKSFRIARISALDLPKPVF